MKLGRMNIRKNKWKKLELKIFLFKHHADINCDKKLLT